MKKCGWSRKYSKCVVCNSTEYMYMANGMCSSCYHKQYRNDPRNKDRIKKQKAEWFQKQPKEKNKLLRERLNFDGLRDQILKEDNYQCCVCGDDTLKNLIVHHVDRNGRNKKIKNNSRDNLVTLCRRCHIEIHRKELLKGKEKDYGWSKKHKSCLECGTTNRKHAGLGLCTNCYGSYLRDKNLKFRYVWSIKHPKCTHCGTTNKKHEAHGLCTSCYPRFKP